jgi:hypothetical protein
LILLRTVGARRAERTCVVRRPPVAGVANAAQNAVGESERRVELAGHLQASDICVVCMAMRRRIHGI